MYDQIVKSLYGISPVFSTFPEKYFSYFIFNLKTSSSTFLTSWQAFQISSRKMTAVRQELPHFTTTKSSYPHCIHHQCLPFGETESNNADYLVVSLVFSWILFIELFSLLFIIPITIVLLCPLRKICIYNNSATSDYFTHTTISQKNLLHIFACSVPPHSPLILSLIW